MTTDTLPIPDALRDEQEVERDGGDDAPPAGRDAWVPVCRCDVLVPEYGVAALVAGVQVALFRTYDGVVHAISNRDPFSGAYVLSRGIVGTRGDAPTVASPMLKQVFDLRTGVCFDDPDVAVDVFEARVQDGMIELRARAPEVVVT